MKPALVFTPLTPVLATAHFFRLPSGVNSTPVVFHRTVTELFEGIERVEPYTDDLLSWSEIKGKHDYKLRQVLEKVAWSLTSHRSSQTCHNTRRTCHVGEGAITRVQCAIGTLKTMLTEAHLLDTMIYGYQ